MRTYPIEIHKPFDHDEPLNKIVKGDVGIYVKHIINAIRENQILEITTPYGVSYANPRKIKKERRIIYKQYLKPEPMMLYVYTPVYGNKEMFEPKEVPQLNKNGASKMLSAWKEMLKNKAKCSPVVFST